MATPDPSVDYLAIIADQSARVCELLTAGPLDAPVEGCPGWTLGDLGAHLVDVQRWSRHILEGGKPDTFAEPTPSPKQAAAALEQSSQKLLAVLTETDPNAACWNFSQEPQVAGFWSRRQALEVAVHRFDAEAAVSTTPAPIAPTTAAHVIDEFLHMSLPRIIAREQVDVTQLVGDLHVHCTDLADLDAPAEWTCEIIDGELVVTDEHRKSTVAMRGGASDLALVLYQRLEIDAVDVFGDVDVLTAWSQLMTF